MSTTVVKPTTDKIQTDDTKSNFLIFDYLEKIEQTNFGLSQKPGGEARKDLLKYLKDFQGNRLITETEAYKKNKEKINEIKQKTITDETDLKIIDEIIKTVNLEILHKELLKYLEDLQEDRLRIETKAYKENKETIDKIKKKIKDETITDETDRNEIDKIVQAINLEVLKNFKSLFEDRDAFIKELYEISKKEIEEDYETNSQEINKNKNNTDYYVNFKKNELGYRTKINENYASFTKLKEEYEQYYSNFISVIEESYSPQGIESTIKFIRTGEQLGKYLHLELSIKDKEKLWGEHKDLLEEIFEVPASFSLNSIYEFNRSLDECRSWSRDLKEKKTYAESIPGRITAVLEKIPFIKNFIPHNIDPEKLLKLDKYLKKLDDYVESTKNKLKSLNTVFKEIAPINCSKHNVSESMIAYAERSKLRFNRKINFSSTMYTLSTVFSLLGAVSYGVLSFVPGANLIADSVRKAFDFFDTATLVFAQASDPNVSPEDKKAAKEHFDYMKRYNLASTVFSVMGTLPLAIAAGITASAAATAAAPLVAPILLVIGTISIMVSNIISSIAQYKNYSLKEEEFMKLLKPKLDINHNTSLNKLGEAELEKINEKINELSTQDPTTLETKDQKELLRSYKELVALKARHKMNVSTAVAATFATVLAIAGLMATVGFPPFGAVVAGIFAVATVITSVYAVYQRHKEKKNAKIGQKLADEIRDKDVEGRIGYVKHSSPTPKLDNTVKPTPNVESTENISRTMINSRSNENNSISNYEITGLPEERQVEEKQEHEGLENPKKQVENPQELILSNKKKVKQSPEQEDSPSEKSRKNQGQDISPQ